MTGSAGVMAVVLAQTVAGATALLFLTPLWHEVKRGFFTLGGVVVAVLAISAWWSAHVGVASGSEPGRWAEGLAAFGFDHARRDRERPEPDAHDGALGQSPVG